MIPVRGIVAQHWLVLVGLPLACLAPGLVSMTFVGMALRYLGDYIPLYVILAASVLAVSRGIGSRLSRWGLAIVVVLVVGMGTYSIYLGYLSRILIVGR